MKNIFTGTLFFLCLVFSGSLVSAQSPSPLKVSGSSTIQPIAEKIAGLYYNSYSSEAGISGGGSGTGIRDTLSGVSDVGMVSRSLSDTEKQQLTYKTIGYDALVFIVNRNNPLDAVDLQMIQKTFDGTAVSWNDFTDFNDPIITINKETGRATLELFEEYSGLSHPGRSSRGKAGVIKLDHEIGSNLEMAAIVGGLPNAIGYLSYGTAKMLIGRGMPIKILPLDGTAVSEQSIISGNYNILRELNLVYLNETPEIKKFLQFFFQDEGSQYIEALGFIPAQDQQ